LEKVAAARKNLARPFCFVVVFADPGLDKLSDQRRRGGENRIEQMNRQDTVRSFGLSNCGSVLEQFPTRWRAVKLVVGSRRFATPQPAPQFPAQPGAFHVSSTQGGSESLHVHVQVLDHVRGMRWNRQFLDGKLGQLEQSHQQMLRLDFQEATRNSLLRRELQ
jgi:hypothetical protein